MKFTQLYPVGFISSLDAKDGRVERKADSQLRYICGWMTEAAVPSESTFSRAFADFARHKLPGKVVESVAVGTVIADRPPPRRSVRALLTHTAPTLDSGFKAKLGIRMQHARRRQPSLGLLVHPVYAKPPGLTAPSQHMPPVSTYPFPK